VTGPGLERGHILAGAVDTGTEGFHELLSTPGLRLERIVSPPGHATPAGEWYDQNRPEWVLVLQGRGGLKLADRPGEVVLNPGDFVLLPAGLRHRVSWTDPHHPTIWLALHFDDDPAAGA
jgi:cupin 2 domain-containing protein